VFFFSSLLFFVGQSGQVLFDPHSKPTVLRILYVADQLENVREDNQYITFSPHFASTPVVRAALSTLEVENHYNLRATTFVTNVTADGFSLSVIEWRDTHVHHAKVAWMACLV
jgi:hypothetical protein